MIDFLEQKWGDLVALGIMATGVAIVLWAQYAKETGVSLIISGMALLKLTRTYRNGNPNGPVVEKPPEER